MTREEEFRQWGLRLEKALDKERLASKRRLHAAAIKVANWLGEHLADNDSILLTIDDFVRFCADNDVKPKDCPLLAKLKENLNGAD